MANYKWVNGQLVDTEIGAGLGNMRVDTPATTAQNPSFIEDYYGKGTSSFDGTGDSTPVVAADGLFGANGFGMNQGTLKGLGSIGDIGVGLGKLFLGTKQLGLAEDKFAFDKDMLNKQYAMAKDAYDKQTARSASIGSQMTAGKVG